MIGPILKAWNGKERLWKVFWIYSVLGIPSLNFLKNIFIAAETPVESGFSRVLVVVAAVIFMAYYFWALISVWRCAHNVIWSGWTLISRLFVALVVISMIIILASLIR